MPQQHERGQHSGRLVEHLTATGESDIDAVKPAGADRDRDQDHHVQGARSQRAPGAVEEDPCRVKDHWQAQDQGKNVVAQPERCWDVEADHLPTYRRPKQDRDGEQRSDDESVPHVAHHVVHGRAGVMSAVAHCVMRCHRRRSSMISMGHRDRGARLGRRICDHVIMPGALIGLAVGVT